MNSRGTETVHDQSQAFATCPLSWRDEGVGLLSGAAGAHLLCDLPFSGTCPEASITLQGIKLCEDSASERPFLPPAQRAGLEMPAEATALLDGITKLSLWCSWGA